MARYVCKGSCKGSVSEEEFNAGKKTCTTQGCENFGQPLVSEVASEPTQPAPSEKPEEATPTTSAEPQEQKQ